MHKMQTIATDVLVAWCDCLSRPYTLQKPLRGSRSSFGWRLLRPREHCRLLDGGPDSHMDLMRPAAFVKSLWQLLLFVLVF